MNGLNVGLLNFQSKITCFPVWVIIVKLNEFLVLFKEFEDFVYGSFDATIEIFRRWSCLIIPIGILDLEGRSRPQEGVGGLDIQSILV